MSTNSIEKTKKTYGFLWTRREDKTVPPRWHFNEMQELFRESIVRGSRGLEIGTGRGYDTSIMARSNPRAHIVGIEISDGVYEAGRLAAAIPNASFVKASALELPLKDKSFDFAYSFGVLHHTPSPVKALQEICRVIKNGAPVFLYLYEDHSENKVKYYCVKVTNLLRKITTRLSPRILYGLCVIISPFIIILFSYPARLLRQCNATKSVADKMPFNFGTHLFSVAPDLYDRLSVPIELRFSRKEISDLFEKNGFRDVEIKRFEAKAGWVVRGYKKDAS